MSAYRKVKLRPQGSNGSFWLSFSDMMSVLVLIFIFVIFFWAINGTNGNGGYLGVLQDSGLMCSKITANMLTPGTITPIVTAILLFLAQRAIKKDEIKVRAADRLR